MALLADLFVQTNNATYIFNQARCFEQNGKYAEAIVRFREYQRKTFDAGKAPDEEAIRHIAECEALIEKEKGPAPAPQIQAPAAQAQVPASPVAPQAPAQPVVQRQPGSYFPIQANVYPQLAVTQPTYPPTADGSGLRVAGITMMVVGALGVGAGIFLNVKANDLAAELKSSPTSYDRGKVSARSDYETGAWLSYGAGITCVVGGSILYYVGYRRKETSAMAFALRPTVGRGDYGAVLQGQF